MKTVDKLKKYFEGKQLSAKKRTFIFGITACENIFPNNRMT